MNDQSDTELNLSQPAKGRKRARIESDSQSTVDNSTVDISGGGSQSPDKVETTTPEKSALNVQQSTMVSLKLSQLKSHSSRNKKCFRGAVIKGSVKPTGAKYSAKKPTKIGRQKLLEGKLPKAKLQSPEVEIQTKTQLPKANVQSTKAKSQSLPEVVSPKAVLPEVDFSSDETTLTASEGGEVVFSEDGDGVKKGGGGGVKVPGRMKGKGVTTNTLRVSQE